MKKSAASKIFISVFILLCLIPSLGMAFFGPSSAAANEILASKPKLRDRSGSLNPDVLGDFADYVSDRFYLRQQCVTGWSLLNAKLFGTSVDGSVVLGRDGRLYYAESLDDYMGCGMSEDELRSVARNLALMQEYCESEGMSFVFTVAPNKNSLYPEAMPAFIPNAHSSSNAARLPAVLREESVSYADLFSAIAAQPGTLYFMTDSHWTSEGAALGADTINAALGRESSFFTGTFDTVQEHRGDLYEMLYPAGTLTETDLTSSVFTFTTASNPNGGDAHVIECTSPGADGSLCCWRDSFGNALYPWLAQSFGESVFLRSGTYDMLYAAQRGADCVVVEIVERNIPRLAQSMPVFPAPVRQTDIPALSGTVEGSVSSGKDSAEGYVRVSCELSAAMCAPGQSAFFAVGDTVYEACVLSSGGSTSVAAWLPSEQNGRLSLLCSCDGILTGYEVTLN